MHTGEKFVARGACKVKEACQPGKGETVRWSITPPAIDPLMQYPIRG